MEWHLLSHLDLVLSLAKGRGINSSRTIGRWPCDNSLIKIHSQTASEYQKTQFTSMSQNHGLLQFKTVVEYVSNGDGTVGTCSFDKKTVLAFLFGAIDRRGATERFALPL